MTGRKVKAEEYEKLRLSGQIVTQRAFAKMVGASLNSIQLQINSGTFKTALIQNPKSGHRKLIRDLALKEWANFKGGGGASEYEDKPIRGGGASDTQTKVGVEVKLKQVKYEMEALKLLKLKGTLVEKDRVYKELFEFGKLFKDSFRGLPDRIVDQLFASSRDRNAMHIILSQSIDNILLELSNSDRLNFNDE